MTFPPVGHDIEKCVHGTIVRQCRCAIPNKPVKIVACPAWCRRRDEPA